MALTPPTCFQSFLTNHGALLAQVVDRSSLAAWHTRFAADWRANVAALVLDGNRLLGLTGDNAIQPDLGYLAVERTGPHNGTTWILLSANPGWNNVVSPRERGLKGDLDVFDPSAYHAFRKAFFPRWWDEVMVGHRPRGAGWWDQALSFVHDVAGHPRPPGRMAVHSALDVIGWELWPFHSKRDGLTDAMKRSPDLKDFAKASLAAALRMRDARVIVASAAGFDLLSSAVEGTGAKHGAAYVSDLDATGAPTDITIVRVLRAHGGRVVGVRRQLFSAWGNVARPLRAQIVAIARGEQGVPSLAEAEAARKRVAPAEPGTRRRKAVASVTTTVVPVAHATQPELNLSPESASGGLVMLLPVADVNGLGDLDPNADEATLRERVGGYWRTSRATDGRLAKVQAALKVSQPVWMVAYQDCRVVRVMRVEAGPLDEMPESFDYPESGRSVAFKHFEGAQTEQGPFARVYLGERTDKNGKRWKEHRVRYRVVVMDDADLCGRRLSSEEPINWHAPRLYRLPAACAPQPPQAEPSASPVTETE